ncbi:uncharacterized protein LOC101460042 [Anopheles sinensis]|uniref:Uncharacterized protein LOC101460042 n=1 Tax=Anopheles sinensis TaxID=74873 RepID=A0A084VAG4_ANOSI|nr:uncharacterized protein LOC101460042 [Anopheles sinensis]
MSGATTTTTKHPHATAEASGDERVQRRSTVRLGIRLIHKICLDSTKAPAALETATVNNSFGDGGSGPSPKSPPALAPQSSIQGTDSNANSTTTTTIPRALRLRLSPKSLKLSSLHRHSSSVDSTNGGIKSYGDHAIIELTETNKVSPECWGRVLCDATRVCNLWRKPTLAE